MKGGSFTSESCTNQMKCNLKKRFFVADNFQSFLGYFKMNRSLVGLRNDLTSELSGNWAVGCGSRGRTGLHVVNVGVRKKYIIIVGWIVIMFLFCTLFLMRFDVIQTCFWNVILYRGGQRWWNRERGRRTRHKRSFEIIFAIILTVGQNLISI